MTNDNINEFEKPVEIKKAQGQPAALCMNIVYDAAAIATCEPSQPGGRKVDFRTRKYPNFMELKDGSFGIARFETPKNKNGFSGYGGVIAMVKDHELVEPIKKFSRSAFTLEHQGNSKLAAKHIAFRNTTTLEMAAISDGIKQALYMLDQSDSEEKIDINIHTDSARAIIHYVQNHYHQNKNHLYLEAMADIERRASVASYENPEQRVTFDEWKDYYQFSEGQRLLQLLNELSEHERVNSLSVNWIKGHSLDNEPNYVHKEILGQPDHPRFLEALHRQADDMAAFGLSQNAYKSLSKLNELVIERNLAFDHDDQERLDNAIVTVSDFLHHSLHQCRLSKVETSKSRKVYQNTIDEMTKVKPRRPCFVQRHFEKTISAYERPDSYGFSRKADPRKISASPFSPNMVQYILGDGVGNDVFKAMCKIGYKIKSLHEMNHPDIQKGLLDAVSSRNLKIPNIRLTSEGNYHMDLKTSSSEDKFRTIIKNQHKEPSPSN